MREKHRLRGPTYCSRSCFYRRRPRTPLFSDDGLKALIPLLDQSGELQDYTIVDPADAAWASQWAWCQSNGYVVRTAWRDKRNVVLRLHRELLGLKRGDGLSVDHINRNPLDNRRANLRVVTASTNPQNVSGRLGTSKYRGVHWSARDQKWRAVVVDRGRAYSLGTFDDEDAAGAAAKKARAWLLPYAVD